MKKAIAAILAALMLAAVFTACNSEKKTETYDESMTYTNMTSESSDEDTDEEITPEELPSAVDLRDYNGKNYVTVVKRQAFGDCWSFGNIAAAETSYIYKNDLGVPAGEDIDNVNFSERYLSWYLFHSITEDDVKPGKVRASQVGEGYDVSEAEDRNPIIMFTFGGAGRSGMNFFASGFGPVDETTEVNGEFPYAYSDKNIVNTADYEDYDQTGDWSIPLNAQYRNPPIKAYLRNGNMLPCPASTDSDGNYQYNEDGVLAIKSEVANGRAVCITALVYGRINYDNWAAYTPSNEANHTITIIGYDDNYPKENFAVTDSEGEMNPESIPPTDGAFIIRDSYGEMGGFDGKGTFYISYHDQSLKDPMSFEFDKNDSVKYSTLNYDQYDFLMIGWCGYTDYDSEAKMANVFDAEEDEYLYQISYKTQKAKTTVHYEIYKGIQDGNPDSGTLLEEGENLHNFAGIHKIDLKDQYELKKGEKYSVVLTMTYTNDDGNTTYTDVIPYANSLSQGAIVKGVVNKGESYLFNNGKWTDITELEDKRAERAFSDNEDMNIADVFKARTIDDIAVDNYPIKAILIPAGDYRSSN